jgi:hypothetical protein
MTQICAIAIALLNGDTMTIADGYHKFHCTNLSRELSRSIEQKFGVIISKDKKEFKSIYDEKPGYYFRYRLNKTYENKDGMERMRDYIKSQLGELPPPKTDKQAKVIKKAEAAIKTDHQERLFQ